VSVVYGTTANVAGAVTNFLKIDPSLSNRIGTSDSNSNQISKLSRSLVLLESIFDGHKCFDLSGNQPGLD